MSKKIIDEVMELVEKFGDECEQYGHCSGTATYQSIRAKLREVLERRPMDYHTVSMAHLGIGAVGQLDVTERIVRWTERAHGIGS